MRITIDISCFLTNKSSFGYITGIDTGVPIPYTTGCKGCVPSRVLSSVTVFKIAEIDPDQSTLTLNLLLSIVWNDTRVTVESNDPNEYLCCFLFTLHGV